MREEGLEEGRLEMGAGVMGEEALRDFWRDALVGAGNHGVIAVCNRDEAGPERNLFLLEAEGVAGAVPTLMVVEDDEGALLGESISYKDVVAVDGVALHLLALPFGEK